MKRDPSEAEIVRIAPEVAPEPGSPHRGLHGLTVSGMAVSALVGCVSMLALVTVRWPDSSGRYVTGALVLSFISFLAFASAAVFTAARPSHTTLDDTSPPDPSEHSN